MGLAPSTVQHMPERLRRPMMCFVAIKYGAQLFMQFPYRHRSRQVGNSTQLVNQARAFLLERGIAVPQGGHRFAARLPEILEAADNGLSERVRALLVAMQSEWEQLEQKIAAIDRELVAEANQCEACVRLREVPGIGAQTATATDRRSSPVLPSRLAAAEAFELLRGLFGQVAASTTVHDEVFAGGDLEHFMGWDIDEWDIEPTAFRLKRP